MHVNPYLNFNGNCAAAFKFYEEKLGGTIEVMFTHGETPAAEHVPPDWKDTIMHARMKVGDTVILASDAPGPDSYVAPKGMYLSLHMADPAEADRAFNALSENGSVQMPIQETFWAARFGMCTDQFGIPWMINCELPASN